MKTYVFMIPLNVQAPHVEDAEELVEAALSGDVEARKLVHSAPWTVIAVSPEDD